MSQTNQLVLVVDDDPMVRELLCQVLREEGFNTLEADRGKKALTLCSDNPVDLVLLDLGLPDIDGFEVCRQIKSNDLLRHIPVMIITGRESIEDKVRGFELGASDYINKPFDLTEFRARALAILRTKHAQDQWIAATRSERKRTETELIRISKAIDSASDAICIIDGSGSSLYHNNAFFTLFELSPHQCFSAATYKELFVESRTWNLIWDICQAGKSWRGEVELRTQNGRMIPTLTRASAIKDNEEQFIGCVFLITDISERKRLENDLIYLASHDPLTHLQNRRFFTERLERAVSDSHNGQDGLLFYMDLDFFKIINDTAGHQAGDRLLIQIARILQQNVKKTDLLARLGGDEFALVLFNVSVEEGEKIAQKILKMIDGFRFTDQDRCFTTSASIGVASLKSGSTAAEVLAFADSACHTAKAKGRNRCEWYRQEESSIPRYNVEADLAPLIKDALQNERFELWLQPIVPLKEKKTDRYEVLVRMSDLAGQPISPGFFVPVAERLGIMVQLDRWIFRRALHFLHQHPKLSLNFNISAQTLNDPDLISYIVKQIDNANVEPKRITFEITETAMIFNLSNACSFLHEVNKLGCGSALDDFGSGFTSLSYLRELPVNILKIDGSFIQNLDVDPFNQTLVKAISDIAHLLGKKTVVEFVENERILETAESLGIDYGQGWYLGKPKPFRSFDQAL